MVHLKTDYPDLAIQIDMDYTKHVSSSLVVGPAEVWDCVCISESLHPSKVTDPSICRKLVTMNYFQQNRSREFGENTRKDKRTESLLSIL